MGNEVYNLAFALNPAINAEHAGAEDRAAIVFEGLGPDNQIGYARFVLDGDEHHAFGRARPLSDKHHAGRLQPSAITRPHRLPAGDDTALRQIRAQERERMVAQRQPDMPIVLNHFAARSHRP